MERACDSEGILGLGHAREWLRVLSGGFEGVDDPTENLTSPGRSTDPFHVLTTLIPRPDPNHIVRCESDRPIIPEIPRGSRLDRDEPIREIEGRIQRETSEFRIAIGENGVDHVGVFGIDDGLAGFRGSGNLKRTKLSVVCEDRVSLEELIERNLAVSEGERKPIVIGIPSERGNAERLEELEER